MRRILWLVLVATLLVGCTALAQTALVPRVFTIENGTVTLLDNISATTAVSFGVLLSGSATLAQADIVAFGGGEVTHVTSWGSGAFIDVEVAAGGTLQITLSGSNAGAKVVAAWIRK